MATLQEKFNLWRDGQPGGSTGGKSLHQRTQAAMQKGGAAVLTESDATPNHADRLLWAQRALNAPDVFVAQFWSVISQNDIIAGSYASDPTGASVTDGDIEFTVNSAIDGIAG